MRDMDSEKLQNFVGEIWDDAVVPSLTEYIRIPNKSPGFDPKWVEHGFMDDAVKLMEKWARDKLAPVSGAKLEVVRLEGRTPLIFMEIPGEGAESVLMYGHLDKQPEMVGWAEGYGPWTPVRDGDKLFGRGSADDGYAMYGALSAVLALHDQKIPHARIVIMIEACEESGSYDLPYYVDHLIDRIGHVSLVICLDSGCGNYDQWWLTTSLRGNATGALTVKVLDEGVHSGDASGIVPSSYRIANELIARIENPKTGKVLLKELQAKIPSDRMAQAKVTARVLKRAVWDKFPFAGGTKPITKDGVELILNRTWRAQLAVTGAAGLPEPLNAGNVMLPYTTVKLSMRTPPTVDAVKAGNAMKKALTRNIPYGADVSFQMEPSMTGWNAPSFTPWLDKAVKEAAHAAFGRPPAFMGEGGSIPFMAMLGEKFPGTQFVVTGVLGPHSNAHGPNEFLHIPTGKRVTQAVAHVLAAHRRATAEPGSAPRKKARRRG
jgi:acetylornithine deacetylase/succinyl-diaminopimelate desuccinylase-like protein